MTRKLKGTLVAAAIVVLGGAGAGIAVATGDDDGSEKPIPGGARDRAAAAALEHTGGGRVTETEVGDEEGYYEVEVTRADGSQVDVHLDRDFKVLGAEDDGKDDASEGEER
jgi:uncharacterized membrane protein YkoI